MTNSLTPSLLTRSEKNSGPATEKVAMSDNLPEVSKSLIEEAMWASLPP